MPIDHIRRPYPRLQFTPDEEVPDMIRPHNPNPEFELGALKKVDLPDGIDLEPGRWTKQFGAADTPGTPETAADRTPRHPVAH